MAHLREKGRDWPRNFSTLTTYYPYSLVLAMDVESGWTVVGHPGNHVDDPQQRDVRNNPDMHAWLAGNRNLTWAVPVCLQSCLLLWTSAAAFLQV